MSLVRSISGIRATLGDSLTPDLVVRHIAAFARLVGPGTVVVGRDGRPSGGWIEDLVAGTLNACGVHADTIGMAPTPTVQLAAEKTDAVGGISISASHNPSEWNGLKFLTAEGIFLDAEQCSELFALADAAVPALARWDAAGRRTDAADALTRHVELALALPFVDVGAMRARGFSVVVDAVNASGSSIVPMLLERCGCRVIPLHCDGTGLFPHTPEPLPENLTGLSAAVVAHGADLGVAVDPDADRLVLIDERGVAIGEEYTITQAADFVLGWERRRDSVRELAAVVNLSTTRAVDDVAARHGARVERTPVGEINVARRMKQIGAPIGGEGSGGVILSDLHFGRDSIAGIVITLMNLLQRGGTLSELRAALPSYHIVKRKAALASGGSPAGTLARIAASDHGARGVRTDDGLRLDFESSWVHMRASNTEPIVRVIAEAPRRDEAEALADRYLEMIGA